MTNDQVAFLRGQLTGAAMVAQMGPLDKDQAWYVGDLLRAASTALAPPKPQTPEVVDE